jgi:hypothetical protein
MNRTLSLSGCRMLSQLPLSANATAAANILIAAAGGARRALKSEDAAGPPAYDDFRTFNTGLDYADQHLLTTYKSKTWCLKNHSTVNADLSLGEGKGVRVVISAEPCRANPSGCHGLSLLAIGSPGNTAHGAQNHFTTSVVNPHVQYFLGPGNIVGGPNRERRRHDGSRSRRNVAKRERPAAWRLRAEDAGAVHDRWRRQDCSGRYLCGECSSSSANFYGLVVLPCAARANRLTRRFPCSISPRLCQPGSKVE